ncbi:MAG: DUF4340 domain-containing protein [Oscillospiraceae bacterium]
MKKKKQKKGLVILLLVLALCVAGYLGIQAHNANVQAQKESAEEAAKVYLSSLGDVTTLSLKNDSGEFSFQLNNGQWLYLPDEDFPLKQNKIDTLTTLLGSLTAVRSFAPSDSLSAYGLDTPAETLTASDSDGKTLTLLFGGATGDNYYAMEQEGDLIYTVSKTFVSDLSFQLNDLIKLETFPSLTEQSLDSVTISTQDQALTLVKETETSEVQEDSDDTDADASAQSEVTTSPEPAVSYVWYVVSADGTRTPLDTLTPASGKSESDVMDTLKSTLSALSFKSCENYKTGSDDLAQYGLDMPTLTVKVSYTLTDSDGNTEDGSYRLAVGSQNEDASAYYACKDSSSAVNLVTADTVSVFTDALSAFNA